MSESLTPLEAAEKLESLADDADSIEPEKYGGAKLVDVTFHVPGDIKALRYSASTMRRIAAGEYKRVKHAHWTGRTLVNGEYHFTCSHCQYGCSHGKSKTPIWDYCPNCGYSMEEKDDGHDG